MKRILCIACLALAMTTQAKKWTPDEVMDVISRVNTYWQTNNPAEVRAFWDNAAYHTGNIEVCKLFLIRNEKLGIRNYDYSAASSSADSAYRSNHHSSFLIPHSSLNQWLDYSIRWAEHNKWQGATETDKSKWKYKNYGEGQDYVLFGDWQICFQTYIDLYNLEGRSKRGEVREYSATSASAETSADSAFRSNHHSSFLIPHSSFKIARAKEVLGYEADSRVRDYWWWADALYMVMPALTKMYKLTGDTKYLRKLYENICYSDSIMLDYQTGLYFRDGRYVYPKHKTEAGKKDFWARGDGWVLAGLAKVLQDMPETYVRKPWFVEKFTRMAYAVAKCQQPKGHWTRSMLDPKQAPGYETSGTAFFCYGLLWGVNNGYLPKKYFAPVVEKAWNYLTTIALQKDGKVGYVQPIGDRAIPGQVINADSQANFGVGAFLLAACEYYRYVGQ